MLNKPNSYRQERVSSLILTALAECMVKGKMLDIKLINTPLTFTKVIVSADLKIANCYFIPFNTSLKYEEILSALNNSKFAIRNFVTQEIKLKYSPEIRFHYDYGFENSSKVEELLKKI